MHYLLFIVFFFISCVSPESEIKKYYDPDERLITLSHTEINNLSKLKSAKQRRKAINKILKSSVVIKNGPVSLGVKADTLGSGTIVVHNNQNFILTARHVAFSGAAFKHACSILTNECVNLAPSILAEMEIESTLAKDFALYHLSSLPEGTKAASFSKEEPYIGDPLWISGIPWGMHPYISSGTIAWIFGKAPGALLAIQSFAAPGSSGGGIFNTKGELIGITSALSGPAPINHPEGSPLSGPQVNQVLAVPIRNFWFMN